MSKIGNLIRKVWEGIKKTFQGLKPELKKAIAIGVVIVDNMKHFVDSQAADVITALIPGDLDDKIKERLRQELPRILVNMKLAETCAYLEEPDEIVACAVKTLQSIGGDYRKAFLNELAVLIAQVAADGKLTWDDGQYILKWYYDNVHKQKPQDTNDSNEIQ